jgi:hypothetical protein
MSEPISAQTVTHVWQEIAQAQPDEVPQLVEQMKQEQPVIMVYLLALDDMPFSQYEREIVFYLGLVIWQIMKESPRRLLKVSRKKLRRAEAANEEVLSYLASDTEADFVSATQRMLETYPEPEVLRYLLEALMEEDDDPENPPIREEYRGLAFILLKTMLDALVDSLAS